jgi:hypothetical protein
MFYDGVFDNLKGMEYLADVPLHMFMEYVPDTAAFKHLSFKKADSYICNVIPYSLLMIVHINLPLPGKIEADEAVLHHAVRAPQVAASSRGLIVDTCAGPPLCLKRLLLGAQEHQAHNVRSGVVPFAPRAVRVQQRDLQE